MTLSAVSFEDGNSINGEVLREFAACLADLGSGISSMVFSGLKVTAQASPNATVRVALGRALVNATESGKFGAYPVYNTASVNTASFAATSTNGRKDRLIIRVSSGDPVFEIVQGTASASPAEPAITGDNFIELAMVTLPASTTNITDAMITDRRSFGGKWAQPWGLLGSTVGTAGVTGATPSVSNIIQAAVTVGANRRIQIDYSTHLGVSAGTLSLANLELVRDSTLIQSWQTWMPAVTENIANSFTFVDLAPAAGSHTYTVRWSSNVSTFGVDFASSTYKRQFVVSDVGPYSTPD